MNPLVCNPLVFLAVGIWLGYELKKILDQPHGQPETTRQYLANLEPKCTWCLLCDEKARAGDYFCSAECATESLKMKQA